MRADNPFVVQRDLTKVAKTRLRKAYVAATLSDMHNVKLGRAEACEGGLGSFARYTPLRRGQDERVIDIGRCKDHDGKTDQGNKRFHP